MVFLTDLIQRKGKVFFLFIKKNKSASSRPSVHHTSASSCRLSTLKSLDHTQKLKIVVCVWRRVDRNWKHMRSLKTEK